jgi:hypothetical protein
MCYSITCTFHVNEGYEEFTKQKEEHRTIEIRKHFTGHIFTVSQQLLSVYCTFAGL